MPQEIEVWYVIPAIRRDLAKAMLKSNLKQKEIAVLLGLTDRRLLFGKQCIAKDKKMIKSLEYGPSRARPQHVVAVPGWGIDA